VFFLYAFDLIELNGDDLRRNPLKMRKATLEAILRRSPAGLRFNEHIEEDGPTVYETRKTDKTKGAVKRAAIIAGAAERVRPKMMTVCAIMAGCQSPILSGTDHSGL
jgi:hypothetical protein